MIRKLLVATVLLCAAAVAQPSQGAPGNHEGPGFGPQGKFEHRGPGGEMHGILPPGRWWKNAEVVKTIGLSDSQVQKIEQVFQESRMKLVDVHATLEKEEFKLEPLLEADSPDEGAVLAAIDRITTARANVEKANAQMAFAIRRVLTPDQWKKLRDMHPHHGNFPPPMNGPRGNRHGDRPGGDQPAPPAPQPDNK